MDRPKRYERNSYRYVLQLHDQETDKMMSITVPELKDFRSKGMAGSPSPINEMLDKYQLFLEGKYDGQVSSNSPE